jgi:hypothetical protein
MSDFEMYVRVCHCGHHKTSHYEESGTCLGVLCDCSRYTDRDDPKPQAMKAAPVVPDLDIEEDCPITLPMIPVPSNPYPHPTGCVCSACQFWYGTP